MSVCDMSCQLCRVHDLVLSGKNFLVFFFKHKTAYDMRISDWSSDVCSSDLGSIAYQYTNDKGARTPLVAITLVDAVSGTALSSRKVEYVFRKKMEDYTGRGETDADGLIRIQVPEGFRSDSYVVTEVEDQEGNVLARTFPVEMGEGTDVQFFPEGGELVNGLASRVAFKATGPGGRGIPVSGVVLNRKNDTLVQLNTVNRSEERRVGKE